MILRALKNIIIILTLTCTFSGCVFEDLPSCTQAARLHFTYTLNPSDSDLFGTSVSHINVYIFDKNGVYIRTESDQGEHLTNGYGMNINLPAGEYTLLGIGYKELFFETGRVNIKQKNGFQPGLIAGETTLTDFRIKSKYDENEFFPYNIESLLKGNLKSIRIIEGQSGNFTMPLIQNKNRINIRLRGLPDAEYQPVLQANNGRYDFENRIPADAQDKIYTPKWNAQQDFYFFDVLRLVENQNMRLMLIDQKGNWVQEFEAPDLISEIMKSPDYNTQQDLDKELLFNIDLQFGSTGVIGITINGWENVPVKPES